MTEGALAAEVSGVGILNSNIVAAIGVTNASAAGDTNVAAAGDINTAAAGDTNGVEL